MNAIIFKSAQSRCIYVWKDNEIILIDNFESFLKPYRRFDSPAFRSVIGFKAVNFKELIEKNKQDFIVTIPELKSSHLYYILCIL